MKGIKWIFFFILGSHLFLLSACTGDNHTSEVQVEEVLPGRWELAEAIRNGKKTPTLEGTYFEFLPDTLVRTNFLGSDQTAKYSLQERTIVSTIAGFQTNFSIDRISQDSLRLITSLRGFDFDLSLVRGQNISE